MASRNAANGDDASPGHIGPGTLFVMPIATMVAMLLGLVTIVWAGAQLVDSARGAREEISKEMRENARQSREADQALGMLIERVSLRMDSVSENLGKLQNWSERNDTRLAELTDRFSKLEAEFRIRFAK